MKKLILSFVLAAGLIQTSSAQTYVSLIATSNHSTTYSLPTNAVASVTYLVPQYSSWSTVLYYTLKYTGGGLTNAQFALPTDVYTQIPLPFIVGPATITFTSYNNLTAICNLEVSTNKTIILKN